MYHVWNGVVYGTCYQGGSSDMGRRVSRTGQDFEERPSKVPLQLLQGYPVPWCLRVIGGALVRGALPREGWTGSSHGSPDPCGSCCH